MTYTPSKASLGSLFLGLLLAAPLAATQAHAQCGAFDAPASPANPVQPSATVKPARFTPAGFRAARFTNAGFVSDFYQSVAPDPEIVVGLWKVTFVAHSSPGLPDGFLVDHGYSVWHSDNTEFLNSSRTPPTGNFCLGVWQKVAPNTYKLNHYAMAFDPTGTYSVGTVNIQEEIIVAADGNTYYGIFSIDAFDTAGVHYPSNQPGNHANGYIHGTRITINTPPNDH